jgi:hypothetical protein
MIVSRETTLAFTEAQFEHSIAAILCATRVPRETFGRL